MHKDPQRGGKEIPEFKIERPTRTKESSPEKAKVKTPEALSPDDHAKLVQFIVDQRKAMDMGFDEGFDEAELKKTNDSLAEWEEEIESMNASLEAVRTLKAETEAVRAKQQKRERSFWGGIAETFSPTVYPTMELNGKQQNMQEILSYLYPKMKIVFLNIGRTPFPNEGTPLSVIDHALRDAGIQVMLEKQLKGMSATLSQEGIHDLFREADPSADLTPSEEQLKTLQTREDAILNSFAEFKTAIEQLMNIKIGKDRRGNMKIDQIR